MAHAKRRTRRAPDNRSIVRRVRAVEVLQKEQGAVQKEQGETLQTLLESDNRRTQREELVVLFITKVIPGAIATAVAAVTGIVWLITHTK